MIFLTKPERYKKIMNSRKEITKLLTDVLIHDRLGDRKYYAKEVTLDYGTVHPKRIDVMQFMPNGTTYASDIEKGLFVCYEIKSCKEDLYSGHGLNFYGEENYIVTTMENYKNIQNDFRDGTFSKYMLENYPDSSRYYGVMVAVPATIDLRDSKQIYAEYDNPTEFCGNIHDWKLHKILPCRIGHRTRSMNELLFCMLRSKHNYTNS